MMDMTVKRRRPPAKRPEEDLQRVVVRFLQLASPATVFFHVPNQRGTRKRFEQELLKVLGVRALGAPYLICRSLAEVEGALKAWGVPLRGRSCE